MAILLGNTVWEGTSQDMATTQGLDGHFFKQLDTGETYFRKNNEWHFINLGLAFIKATKSGTVTTDSNGIASIVFNTPFIEGAIISIQLTCEDAPVGGKEAVVYYMNVSENGFGIKTIGLTNKQPVPFANVAWLATRDYNP